MNQIHAIGIDLAKSVFQVCAFDEYGKKLLNKALRRNQVLKFLANIEPCLVGMEACGSAHYWAREIKKLGHKVRLMPPQYVKPYVKTNKNDSADAEAICEAVSRPTMRFVTVKSEEQQALLLLHRERDGVVRDRTSLINRIRASLHEFGISIPAGRFRLRKWFREDFGVLESKIPSMLLNHIKLMHTRLVDIEAYLEELDRQIDSASRKSEQCKKVQEIPGVGRLTSSALVASIGDAKEFKSGRQLSAWLGLVPSQHSSGGKALLLGISKRGDAYLRRMFIHGARAVIRHTKEGKPFHEWIMALLKRMHKNKVIVALANKLVRIAWAILAKQSQYCATI
ncbi:IS110 family transposase [Bermanella marisrubri]|uniref:IS1111A/IS1328/IS1533 family transposase n=1 Tax=Bermanella marisrubri TaxID=207949 RepID=Q1MZX3_9GAMM|nr:IS110 family transposase [Bermanella marisrubri]EAT11590.1 IS1111A/IS1328/IS1533 family transposase [Oceanobacter sp. RED65] [Bermanella marisrubri]EAT13688.1 IS1111A/IS1328/IS1533 family transposase [Oceanobacter sp. RED65] [Bermanella marisrubri]QIZ84467.1 IS110 family transposase [Bermanella marisrubri]QIZ84949.1 IS110 family transposase [Bermanella marisrubri]